jgi:hypothetical protein
VRLELRVSPDVEELSVSLPHLRAPKEHGRILAVPPLDQVGALLERNLGKLHSANQPSFVGHSLNDLRALARRELRAVSMRYHQDAGEPCTDVGNDLWLVAGHQPELFHPGVWFKNFALYQLARQCQATPLNLIVDTDTAKPAVLHAPAGSRLARVPFDRSNTETPYEERIVEEEALFASLPERLGPLMSTWGFEPLLPAYWGEAMNQAGRTPLLGERLAAARRTVERRWGVVPREAPMSRVCQTQAFAAFACSIVGNLPEFHRLYNQTVQDYRRTHGIRSRSHPVPDLAADGDWLEAPFWAWRRGQSRRGKLMVRRNGQGWSLRVAGEDWPNLPPGGESMIEAWHSLAAHGFKIRSRALTTTLFARLFLADVFIHGIGGGLYDELTDRLIELFFKVPAPGYLILSATLLLPMPRYPDAGNQARALGRHWRDLVFKPECSVETTEETAALLAAKRQWIAASEATHAERAERYHRIRDLNARLQPWVLPALQKVRTEHADQLRRVAIDAIASRRDYAFCLYPEAMLREFFARAIHGA